MKKTIIMVVMVMMILTTQAQAQWAGDLFVERVAPSVDNTAMIALNVYPTGTCSYFSYYLMVDLSTEGGKKVYETMVLSLTLNKAVDIWYDESLTPDTDYTNGCTPGTMAILNQASLKK